MTVYTSFVVSIVFYMNRPVLLYDIFSYPPFSIHSAPLPVSDTWTHRKWVNFRLLKKKKSSFFCLTGKKRLLFDANHLLGMGKFVQKSRKERKVFFNLLMLVCCCTLNQNTGSCSKIGHLQAFLVNYTYCWNCRSCLECCK